jgi:hypothetical protein
MSGTVNFVSDSIIPQIDEHPYDQPFSGKGIEYDPLGVQPGRTGLTLHETGFLPANTNWNYTGVYSPFWRMHYIRGARWIIWNQSPRLGFRSWR